MKIIQMKILFILLPLFLCNYNNVKTSLNKEIEMENIYETELKNSIWVTDEIMGLYPNIEEYNLTKFTQKKFAGNLITFYKNGIFKSHYTSFCGDDYFTKVIGKYNFFDTDKISISVDSVSYSGMHVRPTEFRAPNKIVFKIVKQENDFKLIRIEKQNKTGKNK